MLAELIRWALWKELVSQRIHQRIAQWQSLQGDGQLRFQEHQV